MTDQLPPPPPGANHGDNPKAAAKAAKAYAKATRPWYKKKRFVIPIALVVLIVLISALNGGGDDGPEKVDNGSSSNSKSDDGDKAGSKKNPIKIGETVKLQGTQYTVKSAKATAEVGSEFFKEKADGIYVVVELTIENKKDETKTFSDNAAKLIAGNGKKYSTDSDGTIAAIGDDGEPLIFEDMQPDVAKTGLLVFDIPKAAAKGSLLEVSDLFGRGEAYIDLGLK